MSNPTVAVCDASAKLSRVDQFLAQHDPVRARLILAVDATASREQLWDMSVGLTGEMFNAVTAIGTLDVQLCAYRGLRGWFASQWLSDAGQLSRIMATVRCEAGHTQIRRVLEYVARENSRQKVAAAVIIADACEESPSDLYRAACELANTPVFLFQEGNLAPVTTIFAEIARLTGGACARFDANAAARLAELLRAAAAFAAGGVKALAAQKSEAATLLLAQVKR